MSCFESFDRLCRKIVSPTRPTFNQPQMIQKKFKSNHIPFQLVQVINTHHQKLSTIIIQRDFINLPTIMYLHGNGGNKLQCLSIINQHVNVIAFDFAGCGKSEGQFLTYGQRQVNDISTVITFVKNKYYLPKLKFTLWGRSMGASLALMYTSYKPEDIQILILDTPFRRLRKVMENVAEHTAKSIPKLFINIALYLVQKRVEELTNKKIFESDYLMHLNIIVIHSPYPQTDIPIMFGYSENDEVVREEDVLEMYESYKGRKKLMKMQVRHPQDRPKQFIQNGIKFINEERMYKNGKKGISLSTRKIL